MIFRCRVRLCKRRMVSTESGPWSKLIPTMKGCKRTTSPASPVSCVDDQVLKTTLFVITCQPQRSPCSSEWNRSTDSRQGPGASRLRPLDVRTAYVRQAAREYGARSSISCVPLHNIVDTIRSDVRSSCTRLDVVEEDYHGQPLLPGVEKVREPASISTLVTTVLAHEAHQSPSLAVHVPWVSEMHEGSHV